MIATVRELRAALARFGDDQHVQVLLCHDQGEGGSQMLITHVGQSPGWHTREAGAADLVRIVVTYNNRELSPGELRAMGFN